MSRTALLVQDLQNGIIGMAFSDQSVADSYLKKAAQTIEAARAAGFPIIYVTATLRKGYPEVHSRNKMFAGMVASGGELFTDGDESTKIHTSVAPQKGDILIQKRRVSAFAGSDLDVVLRSLGIEHIVLTGLSTSGVVLSTLRQAADMDFKITVLEDVCADRDDEVHRVLVGKVFPRQAEVQTLEAWLSELKA